MWVQSRRSFDSHSPGSRVGRVSSESVTVNNVRRGISSAKAPDKPRIARDGSLNPGRKMKVPLSLHSLPELPRHRCLR